MNGLQVVVAARELGQLEDAVKELFSAVTLLEEESDELWDTLAHHDGVEAKNGQGVAIRVIVADDLGNIHTRVMTVTAELRRMRLMCRDQLGDMRLVTDPIEPVGIRVTGR